MTRKHSFSARHLAGRGLLFATATAAALALAAGAAGAADKFPSNAIEVVTHAGAGGGTDITTRMMLLRARRNFKTEMVVVSKRGGGGATAMNYINSRPRDGYTIMTITPTHLMTIARGKSPLKIGDLVGLARATDDPQLLMVKASSPFKSIQDLLAEGKKRPLKVGGTQVGGIDQVTTFTFAKRAGIKAPIYVPYKGGGDIVTNLIGGDIEVGVLNLSEGESQISAGEIRPLVVMAKKRMKPLPDVPTTKEIGIDALFSTVRGFVTLKGVPADRVKILEKGILKAMNHSVYQAYLQSAGLDKDSIVGAQEWDEQIQSLYKDGAVALKDLGLIK